MEMAATSRVAPNHVRRREGLLQSSAGRHSPQHWSLIMRPSRIPRAPCARSSLAFSQTPRMTSSRDEYTLIFENDHRDVRPERIHRRLNFRHSNRVRCRPAMPRRATRGPRACRPAAETKRKAAFSSMTMARRFRARLSTVSGSAANTSSSGSRRIRDVVRGGWSSVRRSGCSDRGEKASIAEVFFSATSNKRQTVSIRRRTGFAPQLRRSLRRYTRLNE